MIDPFAPISPVRKAVSAGARHRLRGDRRNYPWASGREVLAPPPHVTLAAAVGSAVISGLAAGSAISAVGALSIGFSTAAALKTLAVGLLSLGANALLSRNARQGSTNLGSGRVQNGRDPITARPVIYGRTRVGGPYIHMEGTRGPGRMVTRTEFDCVGQRDEQVCTPRTVFDTDFGRPDEYFSVVIPFAGHEVDGFEELYFDDVTAFIERGGNLVRQDTQYTDRFVNIEVSKGSADQQAFPTLLAVTEDEQWTAEHRGRGVAAIHSIWQWDADQETLFGGVPNISALVRGRIVYDPRTMSYAWSDNPALCILDFLRGFDVGARRVGVNVSDDEIDYPSFIAAANICDEQVALAAGGSEKRYTLNGTFDLAPGVEPYTIIEEMLTSMAGRLTYIGGRFRLRAASYVAPTITFDAGDLREGFTVNTRQPSTQLYNAVRGTFVSPADLYNPVSYPALVSEAFAAEDGERRFADFDLPFTTSPSTAQRLVQIELNRSRQHIGGTLPLDLSALDVAVGDIIAFDYERFGWTEKEFEVQAVSPIVSDVGLIGFDVTVVETSAAVYDWQTSSEQPFVAGVRTNLPSAVGQPLNLELIPELSRTGDGGTLSYVLAQWEESDSAAIDSYEVRYRTVDQTRFERVNVVGTSHTLGPFRAGATVEVTVRARTTGGRYSRYHDLVTTQATGDVEAPLAPTGITVKPGVGSLEPQWVNDDAHDLAGVAIKRATTATEPAGEYIRVAQTAPGGTGSFNDTGLQIGLELFYWFASYDRAGNVSGFVGPHSATVEAVDLAEVDGQLTGAQIQADAITSAHLGQGSILLDHLSTPVTGAIDDAAQSALGDRTAAEAAAAAAQAARTEAETAQDQAIAQAAAAAGSATTASDAGAVAVEARDDANAAAAASASSASGAAISQTDAANSASAAQSDRVAAEAARDAANASASASAGSASSAASEATDSAQSASAAQAAETNAATSAGQASTSATQAAVSETNAEGSASSASSSERIAAQSAGIAESHSSGNLASDSGFTGEDLWVSHSIGGSYIPLSSVIGQPLSDGGIGAVREGPGHNWMYLRNPIDVAEQRTYRVSVDLRRSGVTGTTRIICRENGIPANHIFRNISAIPDDDTWHRYDEDFSSGQLLASWDGTLRQIGISLVHDIETTITGRMEARNFRIEDITNVLASETAATAAATSASNASVSETAAGTSATAATASATQAAASAGTATNQATVATSQAASASASAASASSSETVAIQLANASVQKNADPNLVRGLESLTRTDTGEFTNPIIGTADISEAPSDAPDGGKMIFARGYQPVYSRVAYPVEEGRKYRFRAWVKVEARVVSPSRLFLGFRNLDQNFSRSHVPSGINSNSYCMASSVTDAPLGEWVEYVQDVDYTSPGNGSRQFRPGTKYIRLVALLNHPHADTRNQTYLSMLSVEDITEHENVSSAAVSVESTARETAIGSVEAKFAVKVGIGGHVSGFGLIATDNNATPTSEFAVLADRFTIAMPDASGTPKQVFTVGEIKGSRTIVLDAENVLATGSILASQIHATAISKVSNPARWVAGQTDLGWGGGAMNAPEHAAFGNVRALRLTGRTNQASHSDWFDVDPTKTYKITFTVLKPSTAGRILVGTAARNKNGVATPITQLGETATTYGVASTNPYFFVSSRGASIPLARVTTYLLGADVDAAAAPSVTKSGTTLGTARWRMAHDTSQALVRFLFIDQNGTEADAWISHVTVEGVDDGLISGQRIVAGSIEADKIAADAITAEKINVGTLSALNANTGNLTVSGNVQSSNFGPNSGYQLRPDGTATFNGVVLSRQLQVANGSFDVGDLSVRSGSNGFELKGTWFVDDTGVGISAWSGSNETYIAEAGFGAGTSVAAAQGVIPNVYWGLRATVLPLTIWSGPQSLRLRIDLHSRNVLSITGAGSKPTIIWRVYRVT